MVYALQARGKPSDPRPKVAPKANPGDNPVTGGTQAERCAVYKQPAVPVSGWRKSTLCMTVGELWVRWFPAVDLAPGTLEAYAQQYRRHISEMSRHGEFTRATDVPVYFCDPASPLQRGSNENTNGLLRQYFPKRTDLSIHSAQDLADVAAELNGRQRKVLGWLSPASRFADLVAALY